MIHQYTRILARRYPDLRIRSVTLNSEGQYNDVLIVNDNLVFRFARVPDARAGLHHETTLLRNLQGRLPLRVPAPIYTHFDDDYAFMGYRMIPGKPLRRGIVTRAGPSEQAFFAGRMARFLLALHQVDPQDVLPEPIENDDSLESLTDLYDRIRGELYTYMRPDARTQVSAHFEDYFADRARSDFTPRIRHGDFGPGNILHDPDEGALTGVIDFGSAGLGDPAADFAALLSSYGEKFYRRCAVVYPDMLAALPRAQFFIGTFALQEALFGAENDDSEAFEAGISAYR